MTHSSAPTSSRSKKENPSKTKVASKTKRSRNRRSSQNSDVLISAVISPYLLTHLHHHGFDRINVRFCGCHCFATKALEFFDAVLHAAERRERLKATFTLNR